MRPHLLVLFLLAGPGWLSAQTALPPVVQQGLDTLLHGHCQDAITMWTMNWPDAPKSQMVASCPALEQYGGSIHGYDVLRTVDITPHLRRVYVVLLYQIQPVYLMLLLYRPGDVEWRVSTLNWNTDPDKVLPPAIVPAQHPGSP